MSDEADRTSAGRLFQSRGLAVANDRSPTVTPRLFLVVSDESAETPGRCIRAKNLSPCSTNADCTDADETCSPLNDAQGQSYCLPNPSDSADDLQQLLEVNAPGKHQAYSRQRAEYGTSRRTKLFVILVFLCYDTRTGVA